MKNKFKDKSGPIWPYFQRAKNDPSYRTKLARWYLGHPGHELDPESQEGFSNWIGELYKDIPYDIKLVPGQPYETAEQMISQVSMTKELKISTDFNDPVVLTPEYNLMYRAVHDHHHILGGWPFTWDGELSACRYFCSLTDSPLFHRILFSELLLQAASALYLGQFPDVQKLVLTLPD